MVGNINQCPNWESQTVFEKNFYFNGAAGGRDGEIYLGADFFLLSPFKARLGGFLPERGGRLVRGRK